MKNWNEGIAVVVDDKFIEMFDVDAKANGDPLFNEAMEETHVKAAEVTGKAEDTADITVELHLNKGYENIITENLKKRITIDYIQDKYYG